MWIFEVIPFIKLQIDIETAIKRWKIPLYQATKRHLNNSQKAKNYDFSPFNCLSVVL